MQAADVKSVLRVFSLEVTASEKDQLEHEGIVVRLRKVCSFPQSYKTLRLIGFSQAGGASYDGV